MIESSAWPPNSSPSQQRGTSLIVSYGPSETDEFKPQSEAYMAAAMARGCPVRFVAMPSDGDNAHRRVRGVLPLQGVLQDVEAQDRRLLRIPQLRIGAVSSNPDEQFVLYWIEARGATNSG